VGSYDVGRAVARLASAQDGVVSRAQLLRIGARPEAIKTALRAGRLIVLHRGVYAVGHTALTTRSHARAALLAAGPHAGLSHRTAAHLLNLTPSMPPFVEVTTSARARRSRPGLVIHQTTRPLDTRSLDGLPVTTPLRTLTDLRRHADIDRLCSEALVLRLVTEAQLERAGLLAPDVAMTRSELERAFRRIVRRAGLPQPRSNLVIAGRERDFAWPDLDVVVETDGWHAHGTRPAFERDRSRDAELAARGYAVLRFTYRQVRDEPVRVAALLAPVLRRRSPRPPGPAAG
jgi:very-short-patch-repair endonuclease